LLGEPIGLFKMRPYFLPGEDGSKARLTGAGTAGCLLANRLSADGSKRGLLIEAGDPDKVPTRIGDSHPSLAPFETFTARDGRFVIAAGNDQLFMLMADALGISELAMGVPFRTNDLRCRNRLELAAEGALHERRPFQAMFQPIGNRRA
jgi:choline dehydrogenase-like flavoprotein